MSDAFNRWAMRVEPMAFFYLVSLFVPKGAA
jgi:hypothetical protein